MSTQAPAEELPVLFGQEVGSLVPIKPDKNAKKRFNKSLAEAAAFAKFGARVIRIKTDAYALTGAHLRMLGVKDIGHGKLLSSSEHADDSIAVLDDIVQQLLKKGLDADHKLVLEVMQLKKEFNKQLIETANSHINADKQLPGVPMVGGPNIAFPAGTPLVVAIGKPPPQSVEDTSKAE